MISNNIQADLAGALDGLDRLMLATSTGVTKSGVTGADPYHRRVDKRTENDQTNNAKCRIEYVNSAKFTAVIPVVIRAHIATCKTSQAYIQSKKSRSPVCWGTPQWCTRSRKQDMAPHDTPAFDRRTSGHMPIAAPNGVLAAKRYGARTTTGSS